MMILNFIQNTHYFEPLIMYFILGQAFTEILQLPQHSGINNLVKITMIINIIAIVIIVVFKAIQHDLMQQCYQYLILQNDLIFYVFVDLATVFNAINPNTNNENDYIHRLLKYAIVYCFMNKIL